MISYRALKKLIGETSLERKCRFLFGIALLALITASFWLYASRTRRLIETQQVIAARMLVPRLLQLRHYSKFLIPSDRNADAPSDAAAGDPGSADSTIHQSPTDVPAAGSAEHDHPATIRLRKLAFDDVLAESILPSDAPEWSLISARDELPENNQGFEARQRFLDESGDEDEYWVIVDEENKPRELLYFAAVRNEFSCRRCHAPDGSALPAGSLPPETDSVSLADSNGQHSGSEPSPESAVSQSAAGPASTPDAAAASGSDTADGGDESDGPRPRVPLMSIAQVKLSLELVDAQLSRNRAILLATGIVTAFLAMLVAWVIVRYVIVKPVLHLKDVSDEIARGNLNLRADISTGDEFEELSHAFNRMLRHMMTVNDELRSVNESLDGKIDQLAQANMELFSNNKLKDDFLATISHELRTPLNSILGFSDILQGASNLDDRQKRYVGNIQSSGQSLMVQINDLLDLAKIESGKMELHPSEVQLSEILDTQVQQIMPLADRKNIDLRIDPPPAALPVLVQDRGKIMQILTNLLSNAVKFTPEGGRIRVQSRPLEDQAVEFTVEDTGIGIPLQEQEQIFEKFRQGSTNSEGRDHVKREFEGTGLGLSIVRELARLMGGDVALVSEFGRGSRFTVRLPLVAPDRRKPDPAPPLESRPQPAAPLITSADLLSAPSAEPADATDGRLVVEVHSI